MLSEIHLLRFPEGAIAKKKALLFSEDCERAELGKAWAIGVPTDSHREGRAFGVV